MMDKIQTAATQRTIGTRPSKDSPHPSPSRKAKSAASDPSFQDQLAAGTVPNANAAHSQPQAPKAQERDESASESGSRVREASASLDRNRASELASHSGKSPIGQQKTAVSLNTASALAGLKPWSKEWVLDGDMENTELRPLFGQNPQIQAPTANALQKGAIGKQPGAPAGESPNLEIEDAMPGKGQASLKSPQFLGLMGGEADRDANGALLTSDTRRGTQAQQLGGVGSDLAVGRAGVPMAAFEPMMIDGGEEAGEAGFSPTGDSSMMMQMPEGIRQQGSVTMHGAGPSSLSGAEFMSTLAAAKQQPNALQQQQQGQALMSGTPATNFIGGPREFRLIDGGIRANKKTVNTELGGADIGGSAAAVAMQRQNSLGTSFAMPTVVTGHVTQGAMTKERLSSESLIGISNGIRNLTPTGGGEIRVRLKPDDLGELHLQVVTNGNQVGLKIQAADDRARKILEESLSHLSESLAKHQLTLNTVDLTVASSGMAQGDMSHQQQQGNLAGQHNGSNAHQFTDLMSGRDSNQQGRSNAFGSENGSLTGTPNRPGQYLSGSMPSIVSRNRAVSGDGRLDVTA